MAQAKFRPYRGTEEKIKTIPYSNGYVYFATDTGKIFLDYNEERLTMGGNGASLFYATDPEVTIDLYDRYYIDFSALDDPDASLKVDDLIINSDGSFYRILEVDTNNGYAICSRIAVSGTGGGGTGPGGDTPSGESVTLELMNEFPATFVYQQAYNVRFKATATADTYINVNVVIDGLNNQTTTIPIRAISGEEFTVDIGSALFQGNNRVVVSAVTDNSGSAEKRYTQRNAIVFALRKSTEFNPRLVYEGQLSLTYIPVGTVSKTISVSIDGTIVAEEVIPASTSDTPSHISIPAQTHGVHNLRAILYTTINGIYIESDPIEYQIAWKQSGVTAPLVWTPEGYPTSITEYEDLIIEYMVWDPAKEREIETRYYKNAIELDNSPRYLNYDSSTTQKWNITDYEVGMNNYTILVGASTKTLTIEVLPDEERDLSIYTGGLVVNLDSAGRSNEENPTSRATWKNQVVDSNLAVTFKNFNWYNNGWIADENGRSCLRISNGASIEIPIGTISGVLNTVQIDQALSFEFRFKVRNVQEYSTLVNSTSSIDESGNVIINKTVETEKSVFGKFYNNGVGLCLGTQEAFFKSSNEVVNARYREDEIVSVSFVIDTRSASKPLLYIYLNGIMSGIISYNKDSDNFNSGAMNLVFNSTYCDVDLYNIRVYRGTKLESAQVVHNYIADAKDVDAYDANQIMTTTSEGVPTIDYNKMLQYNDEHPDETIMPYMVIQSKDNVLPFVKGGDKAVSIEFHNPALDYAYDNGLITGEEYLRSAPSFFFDSDDETIDVQGTSSQGYPRRNYKMKFKLKKKKDSGVWKYTGGPLAGQRIYEYDETTDDLEGSEYNGKNYKKYRLDSDIGETTFCFKADYMESAGCHNTGFATYVKELYSKHPLEDYYPDQSVDSSLRTTVYGFPMLVFQKTSATTYEFIGRYNFNMDKADTDTCGFTYEADSYVRTEEGEGFLPLEEVAECWEFLNNQGGRCSFTKVDFEETQDSYNEITLTEETYVPNKYYIKEVIAAAAQENYVLATGAYSANNIYYEKVSGTLSVLSDFEYRYSYYEDDIDAAIEGTDNFAGQTQEVRNAFLLEKMKNLKDVCTWLESTDVSDEGKLGAPFEEPITIGQEQYSADTREYRLAKFLAEFTQHFDREYCEVYFIMTELLHLYDSRGKNLMFASWGPQSEGGNYIWYPIFYDIDTQLGINNSGVPTWDYSVEPTRDGVFSTSGSVLWNNLWEVFSTSIMSRYVNLRKGKLTMDEMDGYYNALPIPGRRDIDSWRDIILDVDNTEQLMGNIRSYAKLGKRPVMIYNVDQYYKYIAPTISGFINTSGNKVYDTGSFFYCLQGSRELMRYLYLRNRLNYVDSKWHGGAYSVEAIKTEFWARYDANLPGKTSDTFLVTNDPLKVGTKETLDFIIDGETIPLEIEYTSDEQYPKPLDAVGNFENVKSYLRQYMSLQLDEKQLNAVYCDGSDPITLPFPSDVINQIKTKSQFTQQLIYMGGGEYISDLGDLGLKYLDELHIPTLKRLKSLKIGSDVPGYYNAQLNSNNFDLAAGVYNGDGTLNTNTKSLLEEVVLTNLTALNGSIDLSGSEKLKSFRAVGTIITSVSLADGVQIETLHLPKTITGLKLTEPVALQGILEEPGNAEDGFNKGLYIQGLTDVSDFDVEIPLISYDIVGGNLGYDSYKLLYNIVEIKKNMIAKPTLTTGSKETSINLKNVNWSPFTLVEYGESYNSQNTYYIDNERFELKPYTYNEDDWDSNTLNEKIYIYDESYLTENSDVLTDLSILKTFIDSYKEALTDYEDNGYTNKNYFKNTTISSTGPTIPEITGLMYVNNDDSNLYNEADIENEYRAYFPNLKIFVKNVNPSYVITYVSKLNGVEEVIYTERINADSENPHPTYPDDYVPVRLNYDFLGWSLSEEGPAMSKEEVEALTFSSENNYYKLYAIFEIHKYKITFKTYYTKIEDGETKEIEIEEYIDDVPAGEYLRNPPVLPTTDESALPDEERYKFLGWVMDKRYCYPETAAEGNKNIVVLENILSENMDRTYYAAYIRESVYTTPTSTDYFTFTQTFYTDSYDSNYNVNDGWILTPKVGVKLKGKITIPDMYENKPIITISGFGSTEPTKAQQVTHIYFYHPEKIRVIGEQAFARCQLLKIFDWPSGLRLIGSSAFTACTALKLTDKFKESRITEIGASAFNQAFSSEWPIDELIFTGDLRVLGQGAFSYNNNLSSYTYIFGKVQFGAKGDPSNLIWSRMNNQANIFQQNATSAGGEVIGQFLFYKSSTDSIDSDQFYEYVNNSGKFFSTTDKIEVNRCSNCQVIDA